MKDGQFWRLSAQSDDQIKTALGELLAAGYRTEARIIAHLAELEERKLHLKAGSESLFHYCTHVLRLSNSEAFHRITAARIARKFPLVFSLIEQRELHLTALCLLRDYLTPENQHELLAEVCHKTRWQIEELLARRFPRPDVESRVRKLPAPRRLSVPTAGIDPNTPTLPPENPVSELSEKRAPLNRREHAQPEHGQPEHGQPEHAQPEHAQPEHAQPEHAQPEHAQPEHAQPEHAQPGRTDLEHHAQAKHYSQKQHAAPNHQAQTQQCAQLQHRQPKQRETQPALIQPLSEARYRIQLNASAALKDKLDRLRALTSHSNPSGDIAKVIEQALDVALEKVERERFAKTKRPRAAGENFQTKPLAPNAQGGVRTKSTNSEPHRRGHVPNAILREIAARDGLQCSYRSADGCRCNARAFLQVHHEQPWARGGQETTANLRLLCRAHNQLLAEQDFGSRKLALRRAQRRRRTLTDQPG